MPSTPVSPTRSRLDTAASLSLARALRDFGDGFAAVIMPVYLTMLGLGPAQIGLVATLALLGSASFTLLIGAYGNRFGERKLLLAASTMMLFTGIGYALVADYALILPLAFVGTLNPGAGNTSAFVPPEHSWLSRSVADDKRTTAFARYGLIGSMAGAVGALAAGSPELLAGLGLSKISAFKLMFLLYGALGVGVGLVYASLPAAGSGIELDFPVDISPYSVYEMDSNEETHELGDMLTPIKASGNALVANKLKKTSTAAAACARCMRRDPTALNRVLVRIQSAYWGVNDATRQ